MAKQHNKARFGILPSGGTPRDEAAFSNGAAQSVIAVGAKTEVGYHTHVSSATWAAMAKQARSVVPLASQSYTVHQLRRGDPGVREEG